MKKRTCKNCKYAGHNQKIRKIDAACYYPDPYERLFIRDEESTVNNFISCNKHEFNCE